MGFFSLFGKKDSGQEQPATKTTRNLATRDSRRIQPDANRYDQAPGFKSDSHATIPGRDLHAARVTAMKIDEIESEMSSQFMHHALQKPSALSVKPLSQTAGDAAAKVSSQLPELVQPTLGTMGPSTAFLLEGQTTVGAVAMPASEAAAAIEEAAILFASNQILAAEQLLQTAVIEDHSREDTAKVAWRMLFDLYQFAGRQQEFEHLSLEYANRFETSPPPWHQANSPSAMPQSNIMHTPAAPLIPFAGRLDHSSMKQIDRVKTLAKNHLALQLDVSRVTEVDASGCGLLLDVLMSMQATGHRIALTGLPMLTERIKAIIEVGRRDESDAPWLLLLEALRLQNLEREFEETSIDYCVTFEVSPPAFTSPETGTVMSPTARAEDKRLPDAFQMPPVIEGNTDQLILAIASWTDAHDPAIIDCSGLMRIDFSCAGRLLSGLAPFCSDGKTIEFRDVNQLVTTLLDVIGMTDIVRVLPVKY